MKLGTYVEYAQKLPGVQLLEEPGQVPGSSGLEDRGMVTSDSDGLLVRPPVPVWVISAKPWREGLDGIRGDWPDVNLGQVIPNVSPDTAAFYLPYHFYAPGVWGIYILESGACSIATELGHGRLTEEACFASIRALMVHEAQHGVAETGVTRVEATVDRLVYPSWHRHPRAAWLEEAMASAREVRDCWKQARRFQPQLQANLAKCGPGYRDFGRYLADKDFAGGQRECAQLAGTLGGLRAGAGPREFFWDDKTAPRVTEFPLHVVLDGKRKGPHLPRVVVHELEQLASRIMGLP